INLLLFSSCLLVILTLSHADLSWPQPTIAPADSAVAEAESLAHLPVKVPIPPAVTPAITVAIYDDVHLSPRVLADAQDEATRVYQKAGVAIIWIRCKSSKMDAEPDLRCQDPPRQCVSTCELSPTPGNRATGFSVLHSSLRK